MNKAKRKKWVQYENGATHHALHSMRVMTDHHHHHIRMTQEYFETISAAEEANRICRYIVLFASSSVFEPFQVPYRELPSCHNLGKNSILIALTDIIGLITKCVNLLCVDGLKVKR